MHHSSMAHSANDNDNVADVGHEVEEVVEVDDAETDDAAAAADNDDDGPDEDSGNGDSFRQTRGRHWHPSLHKAELVARVT